LGNGVLGLFQASKPEGVGAFRNWLAGESIEIQDVPAGPVQQLGTGGRITPPAITPFRADSGPVHPRR